MPTAPTCPFPVSFPCCQVYAFDLKHANWAPDWLSPEVLDTLRTDNEARALVEAELQARALGSWNRGGGGKHEQAGQRASGQQGK